MSEENKQSEKLKSTLSADVPPFVPRSCNLGLLNNPVPAASEINQVSQYVQDAAEVRESKWHVPVISPASSGIMLLPVTPVLHPDYQFQSSSQGDGFLFQTSHLHSANSHFPSQGKKNHSRKHMKGRSVAAVNEVSVNDDSFSYAPSEKEKKQKEAPSCLNSKIKINNRKDNIDKQKSQAKLMTTHKTLEYPMKLDNSVEFPSLPTVSNKDNLHNQLGNNETCQSMQHCSYSSILQSSPKHLNQRSVLSISDNCTSTNTKEERTLHQNMHRKQKAKTKFEVKMKQNIHSEYACKVDSAIENEQNDNLKGTKNQKNSRYQTTEWHVTDLKQSNSKTVEFTIDKNKTSPKKSFGNKKENTQMLETPNRPIGLSKEESSVVDQVTKPHKSEKKKKRNKKKKKVDPGKVSLLSPEMFSAITNKLNEVSKVNQNDNFNLCDQQDFPNLDTTSLTSVVEKIETEKLNMDSSKQDKICLVNTSSNEKPFNLNFSNLWRKSATYSDILQTANKFRNNEKEIQTNIESKKKSSSDCKKEGTLVTVSKTKEKRKKKKSSTTSDSTKKVQIESGKQVKPDSVIQISIASMVTSLQQVKLNQIKKKETKPRVISTKRGIMDKMANRHNILDSSAPMKKRGKEREKPGRKRLSAMRKVILREREKRRMRLLEGTKWKSEDEDDAGKETDDTNDVTTSQSFADICEPSHEDHCEQVDGKLQASKIILHTRKFRDYCDHMISEEIDSTVMTILKDLVRFQDRLHEKDPIKARMKKRLVYGLREVTKHLRLCKLKCIIIAPNIEKISSEGGLIDVLQVIIELAQEQRIPYVFALQRRILGKVCMKIVPVSCVGIFNYEGVEENYHKLLEFLTEAREKYNETLKIISMYITEDIEAQLLHANISPAAVQPVRSEVLSKIAMYNTISERTLSKESDVENNMEESNTDQDSDDVLQKMENISVGTQQFIQDEESVIEINSEEQHLVEDIK